MNTTGWEVQKKKKRKEGLYTLLRVSLLYVVLPIIMREM
jgi:hypothetical protein